MSDIRFKIAKRIKELRKKYGYTQQYLAEISKVDYKHIQRLESKNPPYARIDTLEKIAYAFDLSLSEFFKF
jgi:transcriptional regulator with XRE-family HTH domain